MSGSTASLLKQDGSGERERLGRFQLLGIIGRGASAVVYEAMDTRMERPVALKVLSFDPLLTPEQRQRQIERFEREARAVARLSHPNIVSVYDVGEADGKHYLVMELLSGVTLRERIDQGGPIALGEATSIVEQIAAALDCTHAEGIVHRDIKPSNILLLPDGRVKMLDFGIARRGEDATVTHTGMLIGSPAYMSPEQGRGENASPSSDIWSLGALLYEMLTGHSPFGASNVAAVLYKAAYDKPEPLPEDVSRAQKVIDHALAKDPDERYASAGALANALRAAVDYASQSSYFISDSFGTDAASKQSLEHVAGSAFVTPSARPTVDEQIPLAPGETTNEVLTRKRSRLMDLAVIAAWMAVIAATLIIVTVRLRQSSLPAAPHSPAKSAPVAAALPDSQAVKTGSSAPSPKPKAVKASSVPSVPAVQVVERIPAPPVAKTTVVILPTTAPPSPPRRAKTAPVAVAVSVPPPTPTPAAKVRQQKPLPPPKKNTVAVPSIEPPWDDRIDRLGDPEPEPEPPKAPKANESASARFEGDVTSSDPPQYKSSVLLGNWRGNLLKRSASLNITSSSGDSFQGTLTLNTAKRPIQFAIQGSFSPVTGRISFWSSEPPSQANGVTIDLGQGNGRLISPKTMGGLSVDSERRVFTWSFSR